MDNIRPKPGEFQDQDIAAYVATIGKPNIELSQALRDYTGAYKRLDGYYQSHRVIINFPKHKHQTTARVGLQALTGYYEQEYQRAYERVLQELQRQLMEDLGTEVVDLCQQIVGNNTDDPQTLTSIMLLMRADQAVRRGLKTMRGARAN